MVSTISKSKYMAGLQCPRLLWFSVNQPETIPPVDEGTQFIFDQGQNCGVRLAILQFKKIGMGHGLRLEKFEIWSLNRVNSSSLIFQSWKYIGVSA